MAEEDTPPPPPNPSSTTRRTTQSGYYVDWESAGVGLIYKDGSKSESKGDFAISLTALVEAGNNTGYLATVKRAIDGEQRQCFFSVESATFKSRFMVQINNSFGSGGMSLAFNEMQFSAFLQFLKHERQHDMPIRKAACTIGQQPCLEEWVLGKELIIGADGNIIPHEQSRYLWLDRALLGEAGNVPSQDVVPAIYTPLSTSVLSRLLSLMRLSMKHNYLSALLVLAGGVMSLHYSTLTTIFAGCPVVVALGPAETGKTTAIKAALSITGSLSSSLYVKGSNAFFLERACISSLPFAIDDPPKQTSRNASVDISDVIIDLYNGGKTANLRKGSMKPQSLPMIATNFDIKSDARVVTRATVIPFMEPSIAPDNDEEEEAFTEFEDLILSGEISSSIGWAIQQRQVLLNDRGGVKELKERLRGIFHGRTCQNWAVLLFFLKQLLAVSEEPLALTDIVEYIRCIATARQAPLPSSQRDLGHLEDVVTTTLSEAVTAARQQPLKQVLQYMRSGTFVNSQEVLAIVLTDVASSLTYSCSEVKAAITSLNFGDTNNTKDFLDPAASTTVITRHVSNRRRKCCTVVLEKVPQDIRKALKAVTTTREETEGEEHVEASGEGHVEGGEGDMEASGEGHVEGGEGDVEASGEGHVEGGGGDVEASGEGHVEASGEGHVEASGGGDVEGGEGDVEASGEGHMQGGGGDVEASGEGHVEGGGGDVEASGEGHVEASGGGDVEGGEGDVEASGEGHVQGGGGDVEASGEGHVQGGGGDVEASGEGHVEGSGGGDVEGGEGDVEASGEGHVEASGGGDVEAGGEGDTLGIKQKRRRKRAVDRLHDDLATLYIPKSVKRRRK